MHRLQQLFAWCLALMLVAPLQPALAQATLSQAQLDQLTAPVALYPDALLSQVLMAATYPADVAAAAQWSKANPSLSGDAATKAVAGQSWDPSVQSLAAFPSVLDMMGRQPQWVQSIGDAFLAQPNDVMDSVQRLRSQAQKAGTLKTTEQQKVVTQSSGGTTIVQIEPANPQVVYVPTYNPTTVYGTWAYPAYPPAYYPPPPGSMFATALVSGIGFGLGVAAVDAMWGGFDWHDHDVNINVNRYNNINVNQRLDVNRANVNWQHNPARRGDVPYNNAAVRGRYDQQRQAGLANRQAGAQPGQRAGAAVQRQPSERDQARDRAARSFEGRTGQAIPGHAGGVAGRTEGTRPGAGGAGAHDPRPAGADHQRADQAAARDRARNANRDSALRDAGNGERVRQQTQRAELAQHQHQAPERAAGFNQEGMRHGGGMGGAGRPGGGEHFGHGRR
ncbi:conserved hypothetical protein [Cupriavidus taiwanensis]|uniref:DUF3300 domain-containing protein n=1 Tax=Cupriavidus taiwanensis TaxID=164546 RepID=A0A375ECT2_9BURK|nr:DUF3300 domain-containing protein [Cupriavidus taiwanensis]SOZ18314.1 conserved hypothetical protein [Cupriavidus taiwanensis]SOZ31277.1 conserved hypothetical protein [Cupriavidus taiwanensis]SOZ47354.1 conserved hypothetical protein [Cupriavidus taiwanensis]SOZ66589.1 conserved hypothetical protein [Cupriavidus taiwanensis]SOZ67386.1 conserved hypothetical protein [Cupriavidus taiwanensis]